MANNLKMYIGIFIILNVIKGNLGHSRDRCPTCSTITCPTCPTITCPAPCPTGNAITCPDCTTPPPCPTCTTTTCPTCPTVKCKTCPPATSTIVYQPYPTRKPTSSSEKTTNSLIQSTTTQLTTSRTTITPTTQQSLVETQTTVPEQRRARTVFIGSLKLLNYDWKEEYADSSSEEYIQLSQYFTTLVKRAYKGDESLITVDVVNFRKGSTICTFVIRYMTDVENPVADFKNKLERIKVATGTVETLSPPEAQPQDSNNSKSDFVLIILGLLFGITLALLCFAIMVIIITTRRLKKARDGSHKYKQRSCTNEALNNGESEYNAYRAWENDNIYHGIAEELKSNAGIDSPERIPDGENYYNVIDNNKNDVNDKANDLGDPTYTLLEENKTTPDYLTVESDPPNDAADDAAKSTKSGILEEVQYSAINKERFNERNDFNDPTYREWDDKNLIPNCFEAKTDIPEEENSNEPTCMVYENANKEKQTTNSESIKMEKKKKKKQKAAPRP